jgi:hypothetical protein
MRPLLPLLLRLRLLLLLRPALVGALERCGVR